MLAHLTGWTMPMPGPVFAGVLAGMESRLRDCALSHAVDAAVAARIPVISSRVSGPRSPSMSPPRCAPLWTRTLAVRPARTPLAGSALPVGAGPETACAPCTAAIPTQARIPARPSGKRPTPAPSLAQTCASQLEAVQRWHDSEQRDRRQVHAVAFGTRVASLLEQAVGARVSDQDWEQRLADAVTGLPGMPLAPGPAAASRRRELTNFPLRAMAAADMNRSAAVPRVLLRGDFSCP